MPMRERGDDAISLPGRHAAMGYYYLLRRRHFIAFSFMYASHWLCYYRGEKHHRRASATLESAAAPMRCGGAPAVISSRESLLG